MPIGVVVAGCVFTATGELIFMLVGIVLLAAPLLTELSSRACSRDA